MHIKAEENRIRIKPGKPTHILIKGNHIRVGVEPTEFNFAALADSGSAANINKALLERGDFYSPYKAHEDALKRR